MNKNNDENRVYRRFLYLIWMNSFVVSIQLLKKSLIMAGRWFLNDLRCAGFAEVWLASSASSASAATRRSPSPFAASPSHRSLKNHERIVSDQWHKTRWWIQNHSKILNWVTNWKEPPKESRRLNSKNAKNSKTVNLALFQRWRAVWTVD